MIFHSSHLRYTLNIYTIYVNLIYITENRDTLGSGFAMHGSRANLISRTLYLKESAVKVNRS
jgi:hypothetical protein